MNSLRRWARGATLALVAATLLAGVAGCNKRADTAGTSSGPSSAAPDAAARGRPFTILAGSELKDLEPALVEAGRGAGVEIKLTYAGTLDIVERINAGDRFDAILPPNGAYPALALATKPLTRDKLFYSRVAIGVKDAKLKALGWDTTPPELGRHRRRGERGQAALRDDQSGELQHRHERAVRGRVRVGRQERGLAVRTSTTRRSRPSSAARSSPRQLRLAGRRLRQGPSALDAMVNYEAVILRTNARLADADKLTLVYPRDGMISADYPLMLLNANKRADDALVAAIKAAPFQRDALAAAFVRPSNPDVATSPSLPSASTAELSFPNKLDVIDAVLSAYQAEWRRPSTSIFVLDISGSMRGDRINAMREALKVLAGVDASTASARYAAFQQREHVVLIAFDNTVEPPQWIRFDQGDVASAQAQLRARADALEARGGTAIFSAVATAEEVARDELHDHPDRFVSIVLLTDGANNAGMSLDKFRKLYAGGAPARVFPILFGEGEVSDMTALAQATGGRQFDGRSARLAQVFKEIRGYQ